MPLQSLIYSDVFRHANSRLTGSVIRGHELFGWIHVVHEVHC